MTRAHHEHDATMLALLADLVVRGTEDPEVGQRRKEMREMVPHGAARAPRVPLAQGLALWARAEGGSSNPTLGLQLAERTPLACFHYFGAAVASAPHLFGALQIYCRYSPYLFSAGLLCEHMERDRLTVAWDGASTPKSLRDFIFAQLSDLVRDLGVRPVRPSTVELPGPAPNHWTRYAERFQCPVTCGADVARMQLRTSDLMVPLLGANAAMHTAITQRLTLFDRVNSSLIGRTVGVIDQLLDQGEARIETVSQALNRSPRSLQQHLAAEGYTFTELLQEVRKRRAISMLSETDLPMIRVAQSLGYRDTGSFSRAFQQWLGESPAEFRSACRDRARQAQSARDGEDGTEVPA